VYFYGPERKKISNFPRVGDDQIGGLPGPWPERALGPGPAVASGRLAPVPAGLASLGSTPLALHFDAEHIIPGG
jgi:hypothetical protein